MTLFFVLWAFALCVYILAVLVGYTTDDWDTASLRQRSGMSLGVFAVAVPVVGLLWTVVVPAAANLAFGTPPVHVVEVFR